MLKWFCIPFSTYDALLFLRKLSSDRTCTGPTSPNPFVLTLRYYIYFLNDKNGEIKMKIPWVYCGWNSVTLTDVYIRHVDVLLSSLFCLIAIVFHCYGRVKIFIIKAHFWTWNCLLERRMKVRQIKLFLKYKDVYLKRICVMNNLSTDDKMTIFCSTRGFYFRFISFRFIICKHEVNHACLKLMLIL